MGSALFLINTSGVVLFFSSRVIALVDLSSPFCAIGVNVCDIERVGKDARYANEMQINAMASVRAYCGLVLMAPRRIAEEKNKTKVFSSPHLY